ncbi:ArnT family glycosyltransferase [Gaoshiqia sediminis]|uniref:Glycosyltransferase family 39 protein n=1 Tax=Gaoshiqia sediminis TaxID=2986998 RepID=A0AA41YBP5_9BACT|nr:glycosyltransferase family 39 protein [Gaoshiqia sediminis]MCW0484843.1 glycosyltransferase family 39 protein [Gaoshiqia sediminis]
MEIRNIKIPALALVLSICAFALFLNVGSYGVIETSDARYAEISREMFESGEFIHPTLLGIKHYHKPPLTYYVTALSYSIFGVNSFAARFFIQLAILIQILFVYRLAKLLFNDKQTALWSSLIYISLPIVLISSRNLTTDPYLNTFVILSIYYWVKYRKTGVFLKLYAFALFMGLGFLTKGPLILIFPIAFVIAFNFIEPPKNKFGYQHIIASILFFAVAGTWFYIVINENHDLLNYFLGHQTVDRIAKDVFNRAKPFWYYMALAPAVGIPWLLFLPFMFSANWKSIVRSKIILVLLVAIFIPFLILSLSSSKLVPYILPLYPLIAILIAHLIRQYGLNKTHLNIILVYTVVLGCAGILATVIPNPYTFSYTIIVLSLLLWGTVFMIIKSNSLNLNTKTIYTVFVSSLFLLVVSGSIFATNSIEANSTYPVASFIKSHQLQNREILVYNRRVPSLSFHLQKPIVSIFDGSDDLNREIQFEENEDWKQNLINFQNKGEIEGFKNRLNSRKSVLILYKNRLPKEKEWLLDYYNNKEDMKKWQIYY